VTAENGLRSSVGWNALSLGGRQGVRVVTSIVLAGMIGRSNFGIAGLAAVYVGFAAVFAGFGLDLVLVQRNDLRAEHVGAATRLAAFTGSLIALGTVLLAPFIAGIFRTPELVDVLRFVAIAVVVRSAAVVPMGLLMRRQDFASIAKAEIVGTVLGAGVGLLSALVERSYWAVVLQLVATEALILLGLLFAERGFRWNTTPAATKAVWTFGVKLLGANIASFAAMNSDNVIVGRQLGPAALGEYGIAYRVVSFPQQIVGQVVARTVIPVFSRLQDDPGAVADLFYRSGRAIGIAVIGPLTIVALSAETLVGCILGEEWLPAVPAVQWLCVTAMIRLSFGNGGHVLISIGRASTNLAWTWLTTIVGICGFLVGVRWGTAGVAASSVVIGIPGSLAGLAVVAREIPITPFGVVSRLSRAAAGALAVLATWYGLARVGAGHVLIQVVAGALVYVAVVWTSSDVREDILTFVGRREVT